MNIIAVTGRLTRDPEGGMTQAGLRTVKGGLAVDCYQSKNGNGCFFIDFSALGQRAEYALKYLHKGDLVAVKGRLDYYEFTTREGSQRKNYTIFAEDIECLARKDPNAQPRQVGAPTQAKENRANREGDGYDPSIPVDTESKNLIDIPDDELPF